MTIAHLLKPGEHILSVNDVYGGTNRYFSKIIRPMGIEVTFTKMVHIDDIRKAIQPNTKVNMGRRGSNRIRPSHHLILCGFFQMLWIETPTNPTLRLVDIRAASEVARGFNRDILVIVDNTFMSPYFQASSDAFVQFELAMPLFFLVRIHSFWVQMLWCIP